MRLRIGLLAIAITAVGGLGVTGCSGKITREVSAKLLVLEGAVSLEDSTGGNVALTPKSSTLVRKGETVRTGERSRADLLLLPGALVAMGPKAAIRLEELSLTKDGNALNEAMSRLVHLRVLTGRVLLVSQFDTEPGQRRVATPSGVLSWIRPGTFLLQVEGDQTRITCIRGAGTFKTVEEATVSMEAGFFRVIPSIVPDPTGVEDDVQAQDDVDYALDMERKLLNMQDREMVSPFPWRRQ
jgi:hypothetical protein